jgi:hypothetical protein
MVLERELECNGLQFYREQIFPGKEVARGSVIYERAWLLKTLGQVGAWGCAEMKPPCHKAQLLVTVLYGTVS